MKRTKTVMAISMLMGLAISSNAAVIIADDFTSTTIDTHDTRIRIDQVDQGLMTRSTSEWTVSGGVLSNAGSTLDSVASEGAIGRVDSTAGLTAGNTTLNISFDYTVAAGATLHYYMTGITANVSPAANEILANTGTVGSNVQMTKTEIDFANMNLLTGGEVTDAPTVSLTGAGTYTFSVNLTGYAWTADEATVGGNAITDVKNFEQLVSVFTTELGADGQAITIDNYNVSAIPEPATLGLVIASGVSVLFIRRRIMM